jgi:FimV-like protein
MIFLIIKNYFDILLPIGIVSIFAFIIGLYFILRNSTSFANLEATTTIKKDYPNKDNLLINNEKSQDNAELIDNLIAIAGDDVVTTQLDLAHAYIETGKKSLAKPILESVVSQGTVSQQNEAKQLLNTL